MAIKTIAPTIVANNQPGSIQFINPISLKLILFILIILLIIKIKYYFSIESRSLFNNYKNKLIFKLKYYRIIKI
jgi:hypothetical protein